MSTLKPYPAYKPAGVPWLQQVPEHWAHARAKTLFQKVERPVRPEDETVTCFRDGMVTLRKNRRATGFTESLKEIGYQGIRKGDLVIHVMDAFAGSMGVSDSEGKSTPVYSVCVPRGSEVPWYFAFQLRQMAKAGWLQALSKGIRERSSDFRFELFGMQTMLVPPPDEQHLIVRYLHALDAKVKRYIRTKRTLIARLQEQKQAIIQRAVTRGLDPNVKLKPSGVEWMGEVPEHWEVSLVKQVGLVRFSGVDKLTHNWEPKVLLCNYTDVYRNDFIDRSIDFMQASATQNEINKFTLRAGDVLLTKDSETADDIAVPTCVVEDLDGVLCGYHLALIRPFKQKAVGEFLFRALTAPTIAKQFHLAANGVTRYALGKDAVKNGYLAMPPFEEQQRICESINTMFQPINKFIEQLKKEIGHITEYHTRLIADVVTGAVDVTAAAKAMAVEADEVMEEEPLSMAAEGDAEYGSEENES